MADIHAEHLAPTVGVNADRDRDGHRHDPPGLAHLHVGRIQPQVRPIPLYRPVKEGVHTLVDLATEPADLAL